MPHAHGEIKATPEGEMPYRVTPAMAAGLTDRLWTMEDVAEMIDATLPKPGRPKTHRKRAA
jgi:hypothetical protein